MIAEIAAGVSFGIALMNGVAAYHLYRQYRLLAEETEIFAGKLLLMIKEDDGEITTDPVILCGEVMDHISQVSGLLKWIRL
ncbi:MAG TPA: hypothetical protein VN429_11080 [Methanospirillum sp.]|uniref:hypothetical protein n=1 Tax=Methanospirillum sp. TaxID=45200 RepID=UPI002B58275E|nr:hypothetical protein [Methanospirillum sp.]HWQ64950.1 hypothetical protein [Methanospirillum sp.]